MKRKKTSKPSATSFATPEIQQIEQLLQFMTEHNLEEFEYSRGDLKIHLRKPSSGVLVSPQRGAYAPEIIVSRGPGSESATSGSGTSANASSSGAAPEPRSTEDLHLVKSPIVGTFYGSPSPGAEFFVKLGAHVENGQQVGMIYRAEYPRFLLESLQAFRIVRQSFRQNLDRHHAIQPRIARAIHLAHSARA